MKYPLRTFLAAIALAFIIPTASAGLFDIDSDGIRNNIDLDTDGDGIPDRTEEDYGLNPYWSLDGNYDIDGDGWSNSEEYRFVTDLEDGSSNPDTFTGRPMQKVFPPYGDDDSAFGAALAIDGDTMVVGNPNLQTDAPSGTYWGAVTIFNRENGLWQTGATLTADVTGGTSFGGVIELEGDTLVVSASRENTDVEDGGAVYTFIRSNGRWNQQSKLTVSGLDDYDKFGYEIALQDDQLLVGCPYCNDGEGLVYVYDRDGTEWALTDTISNCDPGGVCTFGIEIELDGEQAVITAPHYNTNNEYGKAYVYQFTNGTWTEEAELVSSSSTDPEWYGSEADISGDTILVADTWQDIMGKQHGSTYEFVKVDGVWSEGTVFYATDFDAEVIGYDLGLEGDRALLTGIAVAPRVGIVVELQRIDGAWTEVGRSYSDADYHSQDDFSDVLDLDRSGEQAAVGADWADDAFMNSGVAYVIDYSQP